MVLDRASRRSYRSYLVGGPIVASGPVISTNIVDEIQRLTSVVWNDGGTWKTTSFDAAMKQGIISSEEYREVEGEVVFFMVSSAIQKAQLIAPTVGSVIGMFGGQLVSLSVTAFRDSLLTSNPPTDTQTPSAQPETSYIPS